MSEKTPVAKVEPIKRDAKEVAGNAPDASADVSAGVTPPQSAGTNKDKRFSARRYAIIGALTIAVLIGGIGQWFATAKIAGAVIASGSIKVEQNRQIVQHPYGGVVEQILVSEGQDVGEDTLLIRLESSELATEMQIVEGQLAELLVRKSQLEAEREASREMILPAERLAELQLDDKIKADLIVQHRRLLETRRDNLERTKRLIGERVAQTKSQIVGLEAQRASVDDQLALIQEELTAQRKLLEQGLAQASRVLALQREEARLRGVVGQLVSQVSQAQGKIAELELEVINQEGRIVESATTTLRDINVSILQLTERRAGLANRLARLEVRAPAAGTVYDLSVFAKKAVIRPADPLLYIVPKGQPLTVEVKVLPSDIDQIFLEQLVHLKFTSFSQRTTPDLFGRVVTISADAFTDQRTGIPYYLVELAINPGELSKLPDGASLIPGMPVEAFIETTARTPLEYFIQPFKDAINRAFRET